MLRRQRQLAAVLSLLVLWLDAGAPAQADAPRLLRARVVDAQGVPIAGARVRLAAADTEGSSSGSGPWLVESGAEGELSIHAPLPRYVTADVYATGFPGFRVDIDLDGTSGEEIWTLGVGGRRLDVRVRDADSGEPLAGAGSSTLKADRLPGRRCVCSSTAATPGATRGGRRPRAG